jgi:catechol 2,3-dioxygenase-like lactoylglutathione lyase family enzyme
VIKVQDIAYARFAAPDLDVMQRFVTDFGLVVTARSEDALYARGTDPSPYVHVTGRGAPGFLGIAFEAASAADLRRAAALEGASAVEKIDAPGGGQRVRFSDPDGFGVEVVHGRERMAPLPVRSAAPLNRGSERRRLGALQRVEAGPSCVKRVGHAGLRVRDFRRTEAWYKSRFGFVSSDEVHLGAPGNVIAAFLRCDRGDVHVDHHTLVCVGVGEKGDAGLDHAAFEVEDFDAVMLGHDHLRRAGYEHRMGVGRHVLGSQVYDYWRDPWGNVLEHFTDGDLLDASHATGRHDPAVALGSQWGSLAF